MTLSTEFFIAFRRDGDLVIYTTAHSPAQALRKLQNARNEIEGVEICLLRKNERGQFVDATEGTAAT